MALVNQGVLTLLLLLALLCTVSSITNLSLPPSVPAFLWSNQGQPGSRTNYQTLFPEDLSATVKEELQQHGDLDAVVLFVGEKLRSEHISTAPKDTDVAEVLSRVVMSSNWSLSLPYVTSTAEGLSFQELLEGHFLENGDGEIITAGTCLKWNGEGVKRLVDMETFLSSIPVRMRVKVEGTTDLMVVCSSSSKFRFLEGEYLSEGAMVEEVLRELDGVKSKYLALYTTDLSGDGKVEPLRPRGRQLGSVVYEGEEYCNEICQAKAVLLESLLVALTLLIILISGLCCMAGIATPNRFEQSKEGQ